MDSEIECLDAIYESIYSSYQLLHEMIPNKKAYIVLQPFLDYIWFVLDKFVARYKRRLNTGMLAMGEYLIEDTLETTILMNFIIDNATGMKDKNNLKKLREHVMDALSIQYYDCFSFQYTDIKDEDYNYISIQFVADFYCMCKIFTILHYYFYSIRHWDREIRKQAISKHEKFVASFEGLMFSLSVKHNKGFTPIGNF